MIVVGLTGGIGSGKTTVAMMFRDLGIAIYIADDEAKRLMNTSKGIRKKISALFGDEAYIKGELNRKFIASKIFKDSQLLEQMNTIIHPKVASDFKQWLKKQSSAYVIKEAAIIFEHNMQSEYSFIITVTADFEAKINRVLKRDNTSRNKILAIIENQMSDAEKVKNSDFVIVNNQLKDTELQVLKTHEKILQSISKM